MTLASRLTSALHSGDLASSSTRTTTTTTTTSSLKKKKLQIFKSSMALLQVQGECVVFLKGFVFGCLYHQTIYIHVLKSYIYIQTCSLPLSLP